MGLSGAADADPDRVALHPCFGVVVDAFGNGELGREDSFGYPCPVAIKGIRDL